MMALVEIVLKAGNDYFCHMCRQVKEFYRFTKEITLSGYNFVEINDYTIPHGGLDWFPPLFEWGLPPYRTVFTLS